MTTTTTPSGPAVAPATSAPTAPWVLDLVTGLSTSAPPPAITLSGPSAIGAYPGWKQAHLQINMAGFTQANFVVEYEGIPEGHTLNIGDSLTNDGWAATRGRPHAPRSMSGPRPS